MRLQFSSVQLLSCVRLFATPWTAARQASLSITNYWSPLKLIFIESVMPSNHFIVCHPLLFPPSIFSSIRVFSNESALCIWRRQWQPTPVLLPGKSHGWRSLEGCSPRGRWGSDTTERLHFRFSLSSIREGNGNPLQCSCLENPREEGAWWAAVYGIAQSRTRLKWLSSSILIDKWYLVWISILHIWEFLVLNV